MRIEGNGRLDVKVGLKALGVLGIYISTLSEKNVADNILVMVQGKVIPIHAVTVNKENCVLEVDVEKAWDEMGLKPGNGNEVDVEVLIT